MITAILILMWAGMGWLVVLNIFHSLAVIAKDGRREMAWVISMPPLIIAAALVFHILITRYLA